MPPLIRLRENEKIFLSVIAAQGLDDVVDAAAAALVTQGGKLFRITLAGKDGINDGLGAHTVDVAKDMLKLEIHLGEGFLHELELLGRIANDLGAVAHEETQRDDPERGAKGFTQQTGGMELL